MTSCLDDLRGCICLVTGASRGIGRGIALGLGERGATVYITARTVKPKADAKGGDVGSLEETAAEIKARGGVSLHFFTKCSILISIFYSKFVYIYAHF